VEEVTVNRRVSRAPFDEVMGPWLAPDNDSFDGRALYAAKTASDVQEPDGALSVKVPDAVNNAFSKSLAYQFQAGMGSVEVLQEGVQLDALAAFACSPAGLMPRQCKIEVTVVFESNTRGCGVMLHASKDLDSAYYVRLEPLRNRLVFDSLPRPGDIPFDVGVERPITLSSHTSINLKVFVDNTVCVVYADDKVAMNTRLYDLKDGSWGVFVSEGSANFHNIRISTL
jgi:beta-fructofuranosidase